METEHCLCSISDDEFINDGYKITTTPGREWNIVVNGDAPIEEHMKHNRRIPTYEDMMSDPLVAESGLGKAEVTSLCLYSGPMVRNPCPLF